MPFESIMIFKQVYDRLDQNCQYKWQKQKKQQSIEINKNSFFHQNTPDYIKQVNNLLKSKNSMILEETV